MHNYTYSYCVEFASVVVKAVIYYDYCTYCRSACPGLSVTRKLLSPNVFHAVDYNNGKQFKFTIATEELVF